MITAAAAAKEEAAPEVNPAFKTFKYTGAQRVGIVSPMRAVKAGIRKPDYADDLYGTPRSEDETRRSTKIEVYTPEQIAGIRRASRVRAAPRCRAMAAG